MENRIIFESNRSFALWRYSISHSQLLLRSNKTDPAAARMEILFKDVSLILLKPVFQGLSIEECDWSALNGLDRQIGYSETGNLYRLRDSDGTYYVAAGSILWGEDQREYDGPSSLLDSPAF